MYRGEGKGKQDRPEQIKCAKILRLYFRGVNTEYRVKGLKIDGKPTKDAVLDIAIVPNKLAIRLHGGIHKGSSVQRSKDDYQEYALIEAGWRSIDFWEEEMPNLWNETRDENIFKLAEEEVFDRIINA